METSKLRKVDIFLLDRTLMDVVYVVSEVLLAEEEPPPGFVVEFMRAVCEEKLSKYIIDKLLREYYEKEKLEKIFGEQGMRLN